MNALEYRALDFWIGEWDVTRAGAAAARPSRSRIELVEDGCVISEAYTTPVGYSGRSYNRYHPDKRRWEQFWVDNKGEVHHYTGQVRDGNLHYEAEGVRTNGPGSRLAKVRMTFFNQGPDQVRQLGEQSVDGGKTWTTSYDLVYRRRKPAPAAGCGADAGAGAAARAVATGIVAANNTRDVGRILRYYADDAVLLPPDGPPVTGLDAIRRRYQSSFETVTPALGIRVDDVCASGSVAYVRGHITGQMAPRSGGPGRPVDDPFVMVLGKAADGSWRIGSLMWH